MTKKKITIDASLVMSVYYRTTIIEIRRCIESLYNQTVNFGEIIVVIDGPISSEIDQYLTKFSKCHKEFIVLRLKKNRGLANALNVGINSSKFNIICRMDSDDYADVYWAETTINKLKDLGKGYLVSSFHQEFEIDNDGNINLKKIKNCPEKSHQIKKTLKYRNPISHPTIFFYKEDFEKVNGYDEINQFEDWGFYLKLDKAGINFHCIQMPLVFVDVTDQINRRTSIRELKTEITFKKNLLVNGYINFLQFFIHLIVYTSYRMVPNRFSSGLRNVFLRN